MSPLSFFKDFVLPPEAFVAGFLPGPVLCFPFCKVSFFKDCFFNFSAFALLKASFFNGFVILLVKKNLKAKQLQMEKCISQDLFIFNFSRFVCFDFLFVLIFFGFDLFFLHHTLKIWPNLAKSGQIAVLARFGQI